MSRSRPLSGGSVAGDPARSATQTLPPLPPPVDTSTADAEIAAFLARSRHEPGAAGRISAVAGRLDAYPQLTPEAQHELVAAYQASLHIADRLARRDIPRHRIREARRRVAEGEQQLTYLVASNFRLVRVIAQDLATKRNPSRDRLSVLLPDLIGEGNEALMRAAREFDPSRGPKFYTYAARMIRDQIRGALSQDTPIQLTAAKSRIHRIARPLIPELATELGRPPSIEELQEALLERCLEWADGRLTPEQRTLPAREQTALKMERLKKQGMIGAIREIELILSRSQQMARLDSLVGDDGVTTLGDMVADPFDALEDETVGNVDLGELRGALGWALAALEPRERDIMLLRYGFLDGESWTFNAICEHFGVTPERIRQIDAGVIARLRDADADAGGRLRSHLPGGGEAVGGHDGVADLDAMVAECRARLELG